MNPTFPPGFNRGRHSPANEFRKGRPKSVVGPENINAVQKLIMQDCHVTYCEIEGTLGISSNSIYKILHGHLAVKKIWSPWIPHNLTKPCFGDVLSEMKKIL